METSSKKYYFYDLEKILPKYLMVKATNLSSLGINGYAWNSQDAIKIIEFLTNNGILVLGGEVYTHRDNQLTPVYDSWDANKSAYIPTKEDIENSRNIGITYIKKYTSRNGDQFLYSIVHYIPGL